MTDFVGAAKKLSPSDITDLANSLNVEEAALRAVLQVETGGKGFDVTGRPKALFERHVFYKELAAKPDLQANAVGAGLAYPKWGEKPYPPNSDGVYREISAACDIDREAALRSTSWGLGQIMGSNHKMVGFDSAEDMVTDAMVSETNQLKQWAAFVKSAGLLDELQRKDWAGFAKGYNGPGYAKNAYDVKLSEAYDKFSSVA
jgi:N-acetylmuramidase